MVFLPHWPIPHEKVDIKLGLDRVKQILNNLGNPHLRIPPVIHVAGTNGKGSTCAFLTAIFQAAGYKVHRYTSPHLMRYNERITIADQEISDEFLYQVIEETRLAAEGIPTTFFEGTTCAAFNAFAKINADVTILEVGLGGRLDATNVIPSPLLSIITPVSYDHMEYLGDTIAKIAFEKAGIIKPNCPTVSSWQYQEALDVINQQCQATNSPLYAHKLHWDFKRNDDNSFTFIDILHDEAFNFPQPGLMGIHQYVNAAAVVAAFRLLDNFDISYDHISSGLRKVKWPARLERITAGPIAAALPKNCELWLDGAHNDSGAEFLAATIANEWQDKPTVLINGRTAKRNISSFLEKFTNICKQVYCVKVISEPSGEDAENIYNEANNLGFKSYKCSNIKEAIELAISNNEEPIRILVTGSLYLSTDLKKISEIS